MAEAGARRLGDIALFSGLSPDELGRLDKRVRWHHFDANQQILDRDSENRDVFAVVAGRVRIVNYSATGKEIAYAAIEAGDYFGELAAIDGNPRSATAIAMVDCVLAALSPALFGELLTDQPRIAGHVLRRLAHIVRTCDDRIMDLSTLRAVQRIYQEILRRAEPDGNGGADWVIRPMLTHRDLASWVGTSRETVARVLSQLSTEGHVARGQGALHIVDRAAIERMVEALDMEHGMGQSR